eukprot:1195351-Prorocentrum_minimum.AAC.2
MCAKLAIPAPPNKRSPGTAPPRGCVLPPGTPAAQRALYNKSINPLKHPFPFPIKLQGLFPLLLSEWSKPRVYSPSACRIGPCIAGVGGGAHLRGGEVGGLAHDADAVDEARSGGREDSALHVALQPAPGGVN